MRAGGKLAEGGTTLGRQGDKESKCNRYGKTIKKTTESDKNGGERRNVRQEEKNSKDG